jgi:hypothetical protein
MREVLGGGVRRRGKAVVRYSNCTGSTKYRRVELAVVRYYGR